MTMILVNRKILDLRINQNKNLSLANLLEEITNNTNKSEKLVSLLMMKSMKDFAKLPLKLTVIVFMSISTLIN